MSLFQLSLNVSDVDVAVEFYTKLFGVGPAKLRPGYANFVVADPPLKFIGIENEGNLARSTTSASKSPTLKPSSPRPTAWPSSAFRSRSMTPTPAAMPPRTRCGLAIPKACRGRPTRSSLRPW